MGKKRNNKPNLKYPKTFRGSKDLTEWRRWARDKRLKVMSIDRFGKVICKFLLFSCNTDDLCKDFCKPYIIDNRTVACQDCFFSKPRQRKGIASNIQIKNLNWQNVEEFKSFLVNAPQKPTKKQMAAEPFVAQMRTEITVNTYLSAVLSFFEMKANRTRSPEWFRKFADVKAVPKISGAHAISHKPIKLETLMKVINEAKKTDYEDYAVLMLLLYTGGRAQFYGLQLKNITWGKTNGETSEGIDIENMGWIHVKVKGGKPIGVPLHPKLQRVLKKHLEIREKKESPMLFKKGRIPKTPVDYKVNADHPRYILKKYAKKLGIEENLYTHRIRTTVITYGRKFGIDTKFMAAIVGHSSTQTTEDTYRHLDDPEVAKAWSKVDFEEAAKGKRSGDPNIEQIFVQLDEIVEQVPEQFQTGMKSMVDGMKSFIKGALLERST